MSRITETTIDNLLGCSNYFVSGCILYRNKRMKAKDFTYGLVGFVVIYLTIQLLLAYFGGYL
jgi:hypothetical protein